MKYLLSILLLAISIAAQANKTEQLLANEARKIDIENREKRVNALIDCYVFVTEIDKLNAQQFRQNPNLLSRTALQIKAFEEFKPIAAMYRLLISDPQYKDLDKSLLAWQNAGFDMRTYFFAKREQLREAQINMEVFKDLDQQQRAALATKLYNERKCSTL